MNNVINIVYLLEVMLARPLPRSYLNCIYPATRLRLKKSPLPESLEGGKTGSLLLPLLLPTTSNFKGIGRN